jgi:hypothetical protein
MKIDTLAAIFRSCKNSFFAHQIRAVHVPSPQIWAVTVLFIANPILCYHCLAYHLESRMKSLFVIKIGGNVIDSDTELSSFLEALSSLQSAWILVHGGGKLATDTGCRHNGLWRFGE